jgi:hypothetical protein
MPTVEDMERDEMGGGETWRYGLLVRDDYNE